MLRKTLLAVGLALLYLSTSTPSTALAAKSTMFLSPSSGSFKEPFTVDLVIDGRGDRFNAAQATVTLSPNLKARSLVLGDCNLSYLRTPSKENPSFAGVILSESLTKCTVYTLMLVPVAKGQASVSLSKGSVKRYGDAADVLAKTQNASYILTGVSEVPASTPEKSTSSRGLYAVHLSVSSQNAPVENATVTLSGVSQDNQQQARTDDAGTARFSNLQPGVYTATVNKGPSKVGEAIINVSGPNQVLTLGISLDEQQGNPLMKPVSLLTTLTTNPLLLVGTLVIGVVVGSSIALLAMRLVGKRKT